jgi:hypothetical protein
MVSKALNHHLYSVIQLNQFTSCFKPPFLYFQTISASSTTVHPGDSQGQLVSFSQHSGLSGRLTHHLLKISHCLAADSEMASVVHFWKQPPYYNLHSSSVLLIHFIIYFSKVWVY